MQGLFAVLQGSRRCHHVSSCTLAAAACSDLFTSTSATLADHHVRIVCERDSVPGGQPGPFDFSDWWVSLTVTRLGQKQSLHLLHQLGWNGLTLQHSRGILRLHVCLLQCTSVSGRLSQQTAQPTTQSSCSGAGRTTRRCGRRSRTCWRRCKHSSPSCAPGGRSGALPLRGRQQRLQPPQPRVRRPAELPISCCRAEWASA